MTQIKQIKPTRKDKFERKDVNGNFIETPTGFAWSETTKISKFDKTFHQWMPFSEETILKDVKDSPLHLSKEVIADIIFTKETENKAVWNGVETSYWHMRLKYNIRDADNLFFTQVDGKIFIRDLKHGTCTAIALNESNQNHKCQQLGAIEKISAEKATEIVKETNTRLIFSKVETDSSGNIVLFGKGVSA
jgi:hypothetical protein